MREREEPPKKSRPSSRVKKEKTLSPHAGTWPHFSPSLHPVSGVGGRVSRNQMSLRSHEPWEALGVRTF